MSKIMQEISGVLFELLDCESVPLLINNIMQTTDVGFTIRLLKDQQELIQLYNSLKIGEQTCSFDMPSEQLRGREIMGYYRSYGMVKACDYTGNIRGGFQININNDTGIYNIIYNKSSIPFNNEIDKFVYNVDQYYTFSTLPEILEEYNELKANFYLNEGDTQYTKFELRKDMKKIELDEILIQIEEL
ncbi:MAG TPA: hypothetical protein DEP72_02670 [Clostridiales bacterium]|nr:MAG: hypothetical protein A2Y18_06505 [Clostridiales bacterium GWD2_32_19]HCC07058.1 hypothetical protein [Clostridiales bacterium]